MSRCTSPSPTAAPWSPRPTFWGTNPAEVREGPKKGLRTLDKEQDAGRALMMALDEEQKKTAMFAEVAPTDILTKTKVDRRSAQSCRRGGVGHDPETARIADAADRGLHGSDDARHRRRAAGGIQEGRAWTRSRSRGPARSTPGEKHYYRVQGPTFVIEFDNTQNNGNHIHSVWRDFDSDFGRDLLREHLAAVKH